MKNKMILMAFFAIGLLVGCGNSVEIQISSDSPLEWGEISNQEYSIRHPNGKPVNNTGIMGTAFVIFVNDIVEATKFNPNVNLIIQDLKGQNIDLDKYTEISIEQITQMISNSQISESTRSKGAVGEYQIVVYTGDQGGNRLKFKQYYAVANQKAYVLTLTCEESQFDNCQGDGEKIMKTFVVK